MNVYESLTVIGDCDSEETRSQLQKKLLEYAQSNVTAFIEQVRSIDLQDRVLFEVFTTLSGQPDLWMDFILEEIQRICKYVESGNDHRIPLSTLDGLAFWASCNQKLKDQILAVLLNCINSQNISIRRISLFLIGDFMLEEPSEVSDHLTRILQSDADWRVRNFARWALKDNDLLPNGYKQPLIDRLRRKLSNEFEN